MCYNRSYRYDRILRLKWLATGDQLRPLRSSWSLDIRDGVSVISNCELAVVCNATVIEKCETSVTRPNSERASVPHHVREIVQ